MRSARGDYKTPDFTLDSDARSPVRRSRHHADNYDKMVNVGSSSDPIVTRLVEADKVPWYRKPNLRIMYVWLFLCCMGVEMTSGFDSQLINTLQFSKPFNKCM